MIMKKFFATAIVAIVAFFSANAQMISDTNVESYAQSQYGTKWTKAAMQVADENELDQDGSLTFTKTIKAPGMSKDDLYYEMADWFVCNYQNSIQMAEKADGVIVARPYISNLTSSASGWNEYKFDICPMIRVKVTDGQVDITYSLKDYGVVENNGGGHACTAVACGLLACAVVDAVTDVTTTTTVTETHYHHGHRHDVVRHIYHPHPHHAFEDALFVCAVADLATSHYDKDHTVWSINNCYPFCTKDSHKKASAKAFVMATTYSQVLMDNIEAAINQCQLAYRD